MSTPTPQTTMNQKIVAALQRFEQRIAAIRKKRITILHAGDQAYSQKIIEEIRKQLNNMR